MPETGPFATGGVLVAVAAGVLVAVGATGVLVAVGAGVFVAVGAGVLVAVASGVFVNRRGRSALGVVPGISVVIVPDHSARAADGDLACKRKSPRALGVYVTDSQLEGVVPLANVVPPALVRYRSKLAPAGPQVARAMPPAAQSGEAHTLAAAHRGDAVAGR